MQNDVDQYYQTQSAIHFLHRIRVPVLMLQSEDDTFVPFEVFRDPAVRSNPCIQVVASQYGGHLGFLERGAHRFYVDRAIMDWIERFFTGTE